jgi:hypothetical protein
VSISLPLGRDYGLTPKVSRPCGEWGNIVLHAPAVLAVVFRKGRWEPHEEFRREECRLLGYKNPVRTSQETHYVSATESSQLMICKICGFHGGDYEECRLLGHKNPVRTSQETHYFCYRTQPVNAL